MKNDLDDRARANSRGSSRKRPIIRAANSCRRRSTVPQNCRSSPARASRPRRPGRCAAAAMPPPAQRAPVEARRSVLSHARPNAARRRAPHATRTPPASKPRTYGAPISEPPRRSTIALDAPINSPPDDRRAIQRDNNFSGRTVEASDSAVGRARSAPTPVVQSRARRPPCHAARCGARPDAARALST